MRTTYRRLLVTLALGALPAACGGNNALAPQYQPQVSNTPNAVFTFQATGLQDVSDVVTYAWSASSGSVVIHPATNTSAGTITLRIADAAGTVIYNGTVPPSGDITPPAGAGGTWQIRVTLQNYTGTINFEVQMQ